MKGLVHSGGGSKGAWACGVIQYLLGDLGINYDVYTGTSVGAINTSFLAQFPTGQEKEAAQCIKDWWLQLNNSKIYRPWQFWGRVAAAWRKSFYDSTPLQILIRENIDLDKIRNSGKNIAVGALSCTTGKYQMFDQNDDDFISAILASSAFPGMLNPIIMKEQLWIDGGMKSLSPILQCISMGCTEIDVITTSPDIRDKKFIKNPNIVEIIKRAFDCATDKILSNDIEKALMYNKLAAAGISNKKEVKIRIFRPHFNLIDDVLDFDPKKIQEMMDKGYKTAKEKIF